MPRKNLMLVVLLIVSTITMFTSSAASAAGPPCPGPNQWLNDGQPTPTCAVYGPSVQLENRQPAILDRKPAYGYFPATCILVSHAWIGWYSTGSGQPTGTATAAGRVVQDNGSCTGPTVPMHIVVSAVPSFHNIYGVGDWYGPGCRPQTWNESGAASLSFSSADCAGHTYAGGAGDWERGTYGMGYVITTAVGEWSLYSLHQLY